MVCKDMDASFHQLDDAKARAVHLLTCPLCTKQYVDPRVLPCQHTFCCRCLLAHVDRVQSSRSSHLGAFSCPQCRADVGLPAAGASAFPVDKRIRNIRDLVVEEMAKDLASRLTGRQRNDDVCNGGGEEVHGRRGGVSAATRLSNITERPDVDDCDSADVEYGTWPRRSAYGTADYAHRTPATDEPVFSRQRPGYSSVRGASRTRRSRTATPMNDNAPFEAPTFTNSSQTIGDTTSSNTDAGFSRNRPGYSSMHEPRTRRARTAETESLHGSVGRSEGRTMSSSFFGNGRASPQTPEHVHRQSSYVDGSSKSSPFDNINRDDDSSESYTPIIGRTRLAYSSLREKRRRPVFDPTQMYDSPTDFTDEALPRSDGFSWFSSHASRVTYDRHSSIRSQTRDTSEFNESLRRTDQNWTRYTSDHGAHEQKRPENIGEYESDLARASDRKFAGTNKTGDYKTRRQRPDGVDTSDLTLLSTLPDSMNMPGANEVSECVTAFTSDDSQSQTPVDHPSDEVCYRTIASESTITSCTLDEVLLPVSRGQNDVASQLNGRCCVDLDKTDDVVNSRHTEPMTAHAADTCKDSCIGIDDNAVPCSPGIPTPETVGKSVENSDAVDQTDVVVNKQYISSEEFSPPGSPNESCFSRLTKFRTSKNSRRAASSAADSTSKDSDVPTAKPRVRKRPPVFVGTAFSFSACSVGDDVVTSQHSVVRNDELNCESVSSNSEQLNEQQFHLHPPCVSSWTVDDICNDDTSFGVHVKAGLQSMNSGQTAAAVSDHGSCGCDGSSPTAELPYGVESNDVQSSVSDVSQPGSQHGRDEDSAVYSIGVDSDASLRSATEPCLPTPTTDNDDDLGDVLEKFAEDELVSTTQGGQTGDIGCRLDNDDCALTSSESHPVDETTTDFIVEHHQDDTELMSEDHESGAVESGDAEGGNSGGRSSSCSTADELRLQNEQQLQTDDNEDDVTSSNKVEKDEDSQTGFRRSEHDIQPADMTDDHSADGYVLATGLASLGDGSLVVADYGAGCVCLCDGEGRVDHRVTGVKPFSVACSTSTVDEELIYVGDRRRKTLVALDHYGSDVAQWPDNQFDWICGIACLPDGQLAVLDRSRTRQLGIYATSGDDGRPLAELGGQGSSLGDLCMAEFVAADSRGRILVADSGNHCVKAFDRRVARPGVVAVYGTTRGSGEDQLEWPKGVAVDSADNVLVADCRNGRVVSFSVDGRPLGSVVPAVRGPFAICTLPASVSGCCRLAVTTYWISGLSQFRLYDYNTDAIFV